MPRHTYDVIHYDHDGAKHYAKHHQKNLRTWLTSRREQSILARALRQAGNPQTVLDLPCGTGRFWPVFAAHGVEKLIAGDVSPDMLNVAESARISSTIPADLLQTSAFDISLPDKAVDLCVSLRFYHHLSESSDRVRALEEMVRVSRHHVVLSLWVDGNLGSFRRHRKGQRAPHAGFGRRLCIPRAVIEDEFQACGLNIVQKYDVWPPVTMWRTYLLKVTNP
jgi:ubiquinone/menaquinone biosynthesis C-methylase UbiE|tara:strand:- start:950 stop:1615 length:666 start_codon:yes stop_codon:yes gene_type:complete